MARHRQPHPTAWLTILALLAAGVVAVAGYRLTRVPEHPEPAPPRPVVCVDELVTYRDGTSWWTCRRPAPTT